MKTMNPRKLKDKNKNKNRDVIIRAGWGWPIYFLSRELNQRRKEKKNKQSMWCTSACILRSQKPRNDQKGTGDESNFEMEFHQQQYTASTSHLISFRRSFWMTWRISLWLIGVLGYFSNTWREKQKKWGCPVSIRVKRAGQGWERAKQGLCFFLTRNKTISLRGEHHGFGILRVTQAYYTCFTGFSFGIIKPSHYNQLSCACWLLWCVSMCLKLYKSVSECYTPNGKTDWLL